MLNLIENFKEKARKLNKTIVLPEGEEPRVIRAAEKITAEGFAKIIILGDERVIREKCPDARLDGVKIINPKTSDKVAEYAKVLFDLRKAKGMTEEEAERLIKDEMYYGVMMVKGRSPTVWWAAPFTRRATCCVPLCRLSRRLPASTPFRAFSL